VGRLGDPLVSRFAYLFPGQGSQFPGMGRDLAERYDEARAVFDAADAALPVAISELCFTGSAEELALTENTQPAILTVSIAALRTLDARGLKPAAAAGHSLGEYAANVAAATIDATAAVSAVRQRGRFMQEAVPVGQGAMAAIIGLDLAAVAAICREAAAGEVVSPANLNGPTQVVIAGDASAVDRAIDAASAAGARRALRLTVSAPFHCSLMKPAAERLRPVLDALGFRDPQIPVYTNVDAARVASGELAREALVRQVVSAVRWEELIRAMIDDGITTFVEVGPGTVLAGLVRKIDRSARVLPAGDPDSIEAAAEELAR